MKTLYEILEVSENASDEIIEKAYKVLAKKYHPDLQADENRKQAEGKMKEINEAYDVLSNKEKRYQDGGRGICLAPRNAKGSLKFEARLTD